MKRRRSGIDSGLIILILIAVVLIVAVIFLVIQLRSDPVAEAVQEGRPIVIAFLVSDGDELLCTELLLYHPRTGKAALFDIPGEWGDVLAKSDRMDRIDRLYRPNSPGDYLEKVSDLLSIEIPWRIEMDLEEVEHVVDLLEGLELFIANPVEMISDERAILLPSGSLVLDGSKIREYLSYDDPNEVDIERRGRYQKFVQSFLKRIAEQGDYLTSDEIFPVFERYIGSNFSSIALQSLIHEFATLNADYIVPKHVHGDRVQVDDQILLFPHFEGNLIRESVRQTLESLANVELIGDDEMTVILEVLNGTDKNGLGARTAQLFSDFGYDVLPASNAERSDYEHTVIISNTGDLSTAQQVANLIRCTRVEMGQSGTEEDMELLNERADVSIILGMDFDGRYCKE